MKQKFKIAAALVILSFSLILTKSLFTSSPLKETPQITDELASQKYVDFIKSQNGEYQPGADEGVFHGQKFKIPAKSLTIKNFPNNKNILSAKSGDEKWIEVDLSEQRLYAHEGENVVYSFLVSTGKWAPTPTGEFRIWTKLRYSTMSGGNKSDNTYYYLPNVPYVMFFYKGYGLHGTYWHNNFGRPMSHGCVNLSVPDAEKIFWWVNPVLEDGKNVAYPTANDPGTKVVVHD